MTDEPPDRPTAFAIAAAGYAVTAPDYLGLGQSEDLHPYNHLPSTVSASLDALRASREVLRAQRIGLEREVMVTGHSQGAAATLAVGRALPAAHGDDEVPMANAQHCRNVIREHGGRAEVVDVGDVDHQTSARLALPEVIAQFDEQRR